MDVAEAVPHISAILDEIVAEALEDEDCDAADEFIVSAAGILGSFSLPEAAAAAVNLLPNPLHWPWQPELAEKLSTGLKPVALPTVLALLRDGASWADHMLEDDNRVRTWACQLLGGIGDQDAIRPLLETAQRPDADDELRVAAVSAVDEICARDPTAVQLLPSLHLTQRRCPCPIRAARWPQTKLRSVPR
jgi:HEAT repeat protein